MWGNKNVGKLFENCFLMVLKYSINQQPPK